MWSLLVNQLLAGKHAVVTGANRGISRAVGEDGPRRLRVSDLSAGITVEDVNESAGLVMY